MPSTTVLPGTNDSEQRWIVEFNVVGFRILRRADKRRHLLGFNPRRFIPSLATFRPSEAA